MSDPKPVKLEVEPGAVRVNEAWVERESPDIACICIDIPSKYAEVAGSSGGSGDEPPKLYLTAGDRTRYLDDLAPRESMTVVTLPEYRGWDFFCCEGSARYTLSFVLVKRDDINAGEEAEA